jgi:hypothetical protein
MMRHQPESGMSETEVKRDALRTERELLTLVARGMLELAPGFDLYTHEEEMRLRELVEELEAETTP